MRQERRRKDGLGLLPRARTDQEVRRRARANMLVAVTLIVAGAFIVGGSLALLAQRAQTERWLILLFGLGLLVEGALLAGRRERRRNRGRASDQQASDQQASDPSPPEPRTGQH